MTKESRLPSVTSFQGVFCSGFFVNDAALVTAMSLVFDRVHILNNLEYIVAYSKNYPAHLLPPPKLELKLKPLDGNSFHDPLAQLTPEQRKVAQAYIYQGLAFGVRNAKLFDAGVLNSSLFRNSKPVNVWQVDDGTWRAAPNTMVFAQGALELETLIDRGAVPILSKGPGVSLVSGAEKSRPRHLAALLAMKTVNMVLPQTKSAHPEVILEARERLRDFLPPFWNAMFKYVVQVQKNIAQGMPLAQLEWECEDFVDLNVRRELYDLKEKLIKERRTWFHRIITQATSGLKVMMGKPPITHDDLLVTGISLGADVALNVADHVERSRALARDTGLTFLLELERTMADNDL